MLQIRRLKKHVMAELPPLRRKIIRLDIKKSDIASAKASLEQVNGKASIKDDAEDDLFELSVKGKGIFYRFLDFIFILWKMT